MKRNQILSGTIIISCLLVGPFLAHASDVFFDPRLSTHAGESYGGIQDPDYINYDSALREYMAKRIHKQFGITLDPETYSGFDLLEIESLLKCKKSDEPPDIFLKIFPKYR
jgi:hypothetical protein